MEITAEDRQMMQKIIDLKIKDIPELVNFSKNQNVKENFELTSSHDFVIGIVYAKILETITNYMTEKIKLFGVPSPERLTELMEVSTQVTIERLEEIRQAVNHALD